ncbi:MAG TPA: sigma-70 family RNA polymerase sigma factor [Humisphaera sp.]
MTDDSEQFVALMTASQPSLFAYVLSLVPDTQRAEDLLQETNIVLWRKRDEYEAGTSFMSWACQVAYFNVLAFRRKMARDRHRFDDAVFDYLAERQIERADALDDRREALKGCLEKLPAAQRELVAERYEPGGSVQRMAEARGTTEGAVSQSLYRIRAALLACIERRLGAGPDPAG